MCETIYFITQMQRITPLCVCGIAIKVIHTFRNMEIYMCIHMKSDRVLIVIHLMRNSLKWHDVYGQLIWSPSYLKLKMLLTLLTRLCCYPCQHWFSLTISLVINTLFLSSGELLSLNSRVLLECTYYIWVLVCTLFGEPLLQIDV